jgi:transposase
MIRCLVVVAGMADARGGRANGALFSYLSPDAMVPKDHPLRVIRPLVNAALARLSPDFERLYAVTGRASIAPEKLLRSLLLQAFYPPHHG